VALASKTPDFGLVVDIAAIEPQTPQSIN